jgi:hypothetical protein
MASSDLNLDAFTSGMVEFFSSCRMQEGILMMMFKAASNSVEGRTAVNHRFRTHTSTIYFGFVYPSIIFPSDF